MRDLLVDRVSFESASAHDVATGLLGWVRFRLDGRVEVAGVTLRRTLEGRETLSFPTRRDRNGRLHPVVRPLDDATRLSIERQVLAALSERRAS